MIGICDLPITGVCVLIMQYLYSGGTENAGLKNAGLKNWLESDEISLKQPQTSSSIDVSELSQNCVGLLHEVVDVRIHFLRSHTIGLSHDQSFRIGLSAETLS